MGWTYRVVKRSEGGPVTYGIHEAYDAGDVARPTEITAQPVPVVGLTVEEVTDVLTRMQRACLLVQGGVVPVLDDAAFGRLDKKG